MRGKIILFFVLVIGMVACKTSSNVAEPEVFEELPHALLWEISGSDLSEPSYLFGTIHLITKEDFYWPKGTLAAFEDAEDVVFEIDMDDMFDLGAQMSLLTKAFMKDGLSLKDLYSPEDYELVKSHFDGMGIPLFFLERLKPMFLTVFASGDVDVSAGLSGESNMRSYEMEIYDLSQQSMKEVGGLESIEFQMSVFDSIPYKDQADILLETIKSSDVEDDAFKMMVDMYKSQDINAMVSSLEEDDSVGSYEDILLNNRNKNWIPVMQDMMRNGQVFFAVGAGHLGGEEGVINLLREAGYTLSPISNN